MTNTVTFNGCSSGSSSGEEKDNKGKEDVLVELRIIEEQIGADERLE